MRGWGWVLAVVFLAAGRLDNPPVRPEPRASRILREHDPSPILNLAIRRIEGYFASLEEDEFLDAVFSIAGKWKAATRGRDSYERFVRKALEQHLLRPADMEALLGEIRKDYAFEISALENRMAESLARTELTIGQAAADLRSLAAAHAPLVLRDLGMNVVSIAGSELASMIVVSALTTGGVVGTGAATGVCTLGVGLVVGLVAGLVIDAAVGDLCEDAARAEVWALLNELRNRMVDDVTAALGRAFRAQRRIHERSLQSFYEGGTHDLAPARG